MKTYKYVTILAVLNALTLCITNSSAVAAQAKGGSLHRGDQAGAHMSSKGQANTNAQWSADPDYGWVRAEERHDLHKQNQTKSKTKQSHGKHKGKESKPLK